MKNKLTFLFLIFFTLFQGLYLFASNQQVSDNGEQNQPKGYQLMKTYCYACHNPYVESHDNMLAPPMMMVKKHYKPAYPVKEDFVNAIVNWVHHPSEEKVLMPGAVRKFKIMPPLAYPEEDLKVIAAYIFDNEMEKPSMMKNKKNMEMERLEMELNNGEKWQVNPQVMETMASVNNTLLSFNGKTVADYNSLGKEIFKKAKLIIMDENNNGESFKQLHNFFHGMEGYMHKLMSVKSIAEGEKYKGLLEVKARTFTDFFTGSDN